MQQNVSQLQPLGDTGFLIASLAKVILVFTVLMVVVALLTLLERKVSAWMQDRLGPNRVGPGGLGQPLADGIKNILKEETNPAEANGVFFTLAPMLSIIPALITFAVIPFASPLRLGNSVVPMVVADVPGGGALPPRLLVAGRVRHRDRGVGQLQQVRAARRPARRRADDLVRDRAGAGADVRLLRGGERLAPEIVYRQQEMNLWFALPFSVSFLFFWIASFAETNRLPFDLPEAESELVTGYHTEYSSMKFSMFFIAEYAHVLTVSALMATLFLGGWDIPGWGRDDMLGFDARGSGWARAGVVADAADVRDVRREDLLLHHGLHGRALDGAALPLRPGDGPGVEGDAPRRARRGGDHRRHRARARLVRRAGDGPLAGDLPDVRAGADGGERGDAGGGALRCWTRGHVLAGTGAMEAKRAHAQELARRRTARVPVGGAAQP
jgi:hypothetical protein